MNKVIVCLKEEPVLTCNGEDGEYAIFDYEHNCFVCKKTEEGWAVLGGTIIDSQEYLSYVRAIALYNGELVAGGHFDTAGRVMANNIAKWNGERWEALGRGLNATGCALAVYNGEMIAGGEFTRAGGNMVNHIAKWNGTTWASLGKGFDGKVLALAVYRGELYVGGSFSADGWSKTTDGWVKSHSIAKWDGSKWESLREGTNGVVETMKVCKGKLIVEGAFSTAGTVRVQGIAQWDGKEWDTVETPKE